MNLADLRPVLTLFFRASDRDGICREVTTLGAEGWTLWHGPMRVGHELMLVLEKGAEDERTGHDTSND